MKTLKKLMLIILIALITILSLIPPNVIQAVTTVSEVGNAIASVAEDFCSRYASESIYDCGIAGGYYNESIEGYVSEFWGREQAYKNIRTSGIAYDLSGTPTSYSNRYAMDCVGFVSMIIHCATGLGGSEFTYFAEPTRYIPSGIVSINFENVSEVQRGDIICWDGHVAIAISSNQIIDSIPAGVAIRPITYYSGTYPTYKIARIKQSAVNSTSLRTTWYTAGSSGSVGIGGSTGVVDDSSKYVINSKTYGNADQFYYNGMPLSGNYLGHDNSNWLIDALADVADWLIGIITLGYRIQIVGWSSVIQNLANGVIESIINERIDATVTVETILFNKLPILDANFFNFDTAGGEKLIEGDLIYILRQNAAGIYYSIRNIAIIVLLVVLIYVGIRMAISTVAGDKAKYKKMFFSWCVGFIVVMCIHYFMIVVLNVNEQFIGFLSPAEDATVMYDEVRSYAYEIPASKGWTGAIMYAFLVYYMIKLLIFYFKRLLIIFVLVILGPIIGLSYAIEMIKGKSKSFTTWMKEFSFNVLIQSVHIIIYSLFMNIIYSFMKSANIINLIPYAVLMILVLNLMMRSEKIIKKVFGLKANTMKDIVDSAIKVSATVMNMVAIANPIYRFGKSKVIDGYNKSIDNKIDNKYKHLENSAEKVNGSKIATDIQKQIDRLKEQEKAQIKQYNANAINLGKNIFGGLGGIVKSVPIMFEAGPTQGTISLINSASRLNSGFESIGNLNLKEEKIDKLLEKYNMLPVKNTVNGTNINKTTTSQSNSNIGNSSNSNGKTIRTYNTEKKKKYNVAKGIGGFAAASATARTSTRAKNIIMAGKNEKEKLNNPYQTARIELLYKLQAEVLKEEEKLNNSINNLRESGFPPVFYTPGENESNTTIAMNLKLKEEYVKQLEINLKQAMEGKPRIDITTVNEHIMNYTIDNGHAPIKLNELQELLDKIAEEQNYDVGDKFEENLNKTVQKSIIDLVEGKESKIDKNAVKSEIIKKVEIALKNNNWDEKATQSDITTIITNDVVEDVIGVLSASELTSIISASVNLNGSLKKKPVMPEFEEIVESSAKIADMNNDILELEGAGKYNADELIQSILNKDILD